MSIVSSKTTNPTVGAAHVTRKLAFGLSVGLVAILAGCASKPQTSFNVAPETYQHRHPIVVSEAPTVLDIPVGHERTHLTAGMRSAISGFAREYRTSGAKALDIMVPSGAPNEAAAGHIARHAREVLVKSGVPHRRVSIVPYQAHSAEHPGNVRLSFASIKASVASECGVWPTDISFDFKNENYHNFGCASQSNLAAIVADPNDLINPRGLGEINAERAAIVQESFESNETPVLTPVTVSDF